MFEKSNERTMAKVTEGMFKGRIAVTQGLADKNGFIKSFLVNGDGTVQNEYLFLNVNKIKRFKKTVYK